MLFLTELFSHFLRTASEAYRGKRCVEYRIKQISYSEMNNISPLDTIHVSAVAYTVCLINFL